MNQIIINTTKNKFDALLSGIQGNIDILMLSETKLEVASLLGNFA